MHAGSKIWIGTSGWHYEHWKGPFYRPSSSRAEWLARYAEHFRTVEVNNAFYQLPAAETLETWRDTVPPGFVFSVKASRFITHMKKLKEPQESLGLFLERVAALGAKLGPVLFQLPGRWHFNGERLLSFLDALPAGHRYAFEFRDRSWHTPEAVEALRAHGAAFCIYELDGYLTPKEVTADFVYIRLHGPGGAYKGSYSKQTLAGWAGAISAWARRGRAVFCYFDNDEQGHAPQNALTLSAMLDG